MKKIIALAILVIMILISCSYPTYINYVVQNDTYDELLIELELHDGKDKFYLVKPQSKSTIYIQQDREDVEFMFVSDTTDSPYRIQYFNSISIYKIINDSSILVNEDFNLRQHWTFLEESSREADYQLIIED